MCDWCDSPATHRHVSATETVAACRLHFTLYLGVLARRRALAAR